MEKHQTKSDSSSQTPIKSMGGQELREEEKVWREVATGEARMTLMRKMIKEDLAFADLQAFGEDFNNLFHIF